MYEGRGKGEVGRRKGSRYEVMGKDGNGRKSEGGGWAVVPFSVSPKKTGRREPGIIHSKSCRLPVPRSGATNQIAE